MKNIKFIKIFLFLLCITTIIPDEQKSDDIDYLNLAIRIFESLEPKCFPEINETFHERMKFEKDKRYPWITDTMGKGINDIGDEVECLNSLKNTTFFMVNFYKLNLTKILDNDQELMNFLEIKNFSLGFCLMQTCREAFERYIPILAEFINSLTSDNKNANAKDLVSFIVDNKIDNDTKNVNNDYGLETQDLKQTIFYLVIAFGLLKVVAAIVRIIIIPKGYDKYAAEQLNQLNNEENKNTDIEEKVNLAQKRKFNEPLNEESNTKEYNPLFDFSETLKIWIRTLRVLDIINDIHYLSSKRNRYFNDSGLEIIVFNRAIVIFFLIFSNTFSALIALPSEEIINSSFFKSWLNIVYRLSNNALICWGFLEGAYTTYKLMSFITSEMFVYNAEGEKKNNKMYLKLLLIYLKFLVLMIPKLATFFVIYYILYYRIEDFRFLFDAKATFHHIITNIFKFGIHCDLDGRIFDNVFQNQIEDYNVCYEFTYFYFNIFVSTLISMVLIYFFLLIKQKAIEIIFIVGNLFIYFYFVFIVNDKRDKLQQGSNNQVLLLHYHIKGETYSTKIFQTFLGFYNLGLILGFLIFNSDNLKQKINRLLYEYNGIHLKKIHDNKKDETKLILAEPLSENDDTDMTDESGGQSEGSIKNEQVFAEDSPNYYKNFILPYYPFDFLNKLLNPIKRLKFSTKIFFIIIFILLLIFIDLSLLLFVLTSDKFEIEFNSLAHFLFHGEKHFFVLVYFLIIVFMITLPKRGALRDFMTSKLAVCISRIGFLITCISHAFTYISFLIFSLKVKLYVPTFVIISFGNFLQFFILCVLFSALIELPLRILIKKLMRLKRKKESIIL